MGLGVDNRLETAGNGIAIGTALAQAFEMTDLGTIARPKRRSD